MGLVTDTGIFDMNGNYVMKDDISSYINTIPIECRNLNWMPKKGTYCRAKPKINLDKLAPKQIAILAMRASLRIIPIIHIISKKYKFPFEFWQENAYDNLFIQFKIWTNNYLKILNIDEKKCFAYEDNLYPLDLKEPFLYIHDISASSSRSKGILYCIDISDGGAIEYCKQAIGYAIDATELTEWSHEFNQSVKLDIKNLEQNQDIYFYPLWNNTIPKKFLEDLKLFKNDVLELDNDFKIFIDWYEDVLYGRKIDFNTLNKWVKIPDEVTTLGKKAINAYMKSIVENNSWKPLNTVRAIFIGHGNSGKTSLIRTLYNETVVEGKEKMTAGIDIRELPIENTDIKAKLWDFGGQVMTHATHQFFLRERCLYVLVIDARSEINSNEQAQYWLEHIKAFGNNASVIIVGNKSDNISVNLDMSTLIEKYPNIVGFYPLSCTEYKNDGVYKKQYELFKENFEKELLKIDTHQVYFTQGQFTVLTQLRELSANNAFISKDDFIDLCNENKIGEIGLSLDNYLSLLDSLGEVIHFKNIPFLDAYILNPRWLTYGVYTLLFSDKVEKGYLKESDVIDILSTATVKDEYGNQLTYPADKCAFIIDAMEEFKLCYRLPHNRREFVIPDKLEAIQPTIDFDKNREDTISLEFDFKSFLPRHIIGTLIVSRYEEIKDNLVWQNGVILYSVEYQATARVQVDYHSRVLSLWIQGNNTKEYLSVLREEVLRILNRMESLEYKEMVVLPKSTCVTPHLLSDNHINKIAYKMLLSMKRDKNQFCYSETGLQYDIDKIFGEIIVERKETKIFISNHYINYGNIVKVGNGNRGLKIEQLKDKKWKWRL